MLILIIIYINIYVFQRNILLTSSGGCLKMEVVCLFYVYCPFWQHGWPSIGLWGLPHNGTPSSIQLSRSVHLCLLASPFQGPNERESLSRPRLTNLPTNEWQSRLAGRNPDKRREFRLRTFIDWLWRFEWSWWSAVVEWLDKDSESGGCLRPDLL